MEEWISAINSTSTNISAANSHISLKLNNEDNRDSQIEEDQGEIYATIEEIRGETPKNKRATVLPQLPPRRQFKEEIKIMSENKDIDYVNTAKYNHSNLSNEEGDIIEEAEYHEPSENFLSNANANNKITQEETAEDEAEYHEPSEEFLSNKTTPTRIGNSNAKENSKKKETKHINTKLVKENNVDISYDEFSSSQMRRDDKNNNLQRKVPKVQNPNNIVEEETDYDEIGHFRQETQQNNTSKNIINQVETKKHSSNVAEYEEDDIYDEIVAPPRQICSDIKNEAVDLKTSKPEEEEEEPIYDSFINVTNNDNIIKNKPKEIEKKSEIEIKKKTFQENINKKKEEKNKNPVKLSQKITEEEEDTVYDELGTPNIPQNKNAKSPKISLTKTNTVQKDFKLTPFKNAKPEKPVKPLKISGSKNTPSDQFASITPRRRLSGKYGKEQKKEDNNHKEDVKGGPKKLNSGVLEHMERSLGFLKK